MGFISFLGMAETYRKLQSAYGVVTDHKKLLSHEALAKLMTSLAVSASCDIDMFFLPLVTTCCGLMGISKAVTHREDIFFEEPNIIWSCVAAEPGKQLWSG